MADIQYNKIQVSVIGAGGLGREIDSWIAKDSSTDFEVTGFWDDNLDALRKYTIEKEVYGVIDASVIYGTVILGIMNCSFKQKIFYQLNNNPLINICAYIHESVSIGLRTIVGEGVVLFPNVIVSCDVEIGKGSFLNLGTQVGHDVVIGNFASIMPNVDLGGGVVLGDNVFIGTGATILPGVKIASNTRIGAGSVVLKSIKKEGTYFGNPAKNIF